MTTTNYQTEIQSPGSIRWGSAKIEIYDLVSKQNINIGALKNISATTTTTGEQRFKPDNAPPIIRDPVPETWDWTFELQEGWNPQVLKLLRGDIDTYKVDEKQKITTIGVYAGVGNRPKNKVIITNTTPGMQNHIITLYSAKCISELDFTYPTDEDGTVPVALQVKLVAELVGSTGFGTIETPGIIPGINPSPEEEK